MNYKILIRVIIPITVLIIIGGVIYYRVHKTSSALVTNAPVSLVPLTNPNALKVHYREKITLPDIGNTKEISNHQVFIKLDTKSLIQENKLTLDCSNIYFTNLQGDKIPFWAPNDQCYSEASVYWLNISNIAPHESKEIYVYYSNEPAVSESNFDAVFSQQNTPGLVAGYFLGAMMFEKDFSGHKNDGVLSSFDDGGYFPTFNHWGCGPGGDTISQEYPCSEAEKNNYNFTASTTRNIDLSQGSIELWINPDVTISDNYQKIISDSNGGIELGMQPSGNLYFYPAQAGGSNYNLINNPLKKQTWNHVVVTWDFTTKETIFYINGKKIVNNINYTPSLWAEKANLGDSWRVGGFAFAGELSGLRIYSKALSPQEVTNAYIADNQSAIGPQVTFGNEELVSKAGELIDPFVASSTISRIPITDKIELTRHYSSPLEGDGSTSDSQPYNRVGSESGNFTYEAHPAYLISENDDGGYYGDKVIFGEPSHFDAYAGTFIRVNGSFLLTHVGLRISDPSLVRNLKVQLGTGGYYGMGYNVEDKPSLLKNILAFLAPVAHACGGGSYSEIGESDLNFVETLSGISWYALKIPILASPANTLQISYLPNGKGGFLSVGLADMIFQDENRNLVRIAQDTDPANNYYAYIVPEENGKIELKQSVQGGGLSLLFENQGKDEFTIDMNSLNSIQSLYGKAIQNINIRDSAGKILKTITIQDIKNNILGKTIQPASEISMSVPLDGLNNNSTYFITLEYGTPLGGIDQNEKKIIHWTLGNSSYSYPSVSAQWADSNLYKLDIDSVGKMTFSSPNN